jgi:hypothetical protein
MMFAQPRIKKARQGKPANAARAPKLSPRSTTKLFVIGLQSIINGDYPTIDRAFADDFAKATNNRIADQPRHLQNQFRTRCLGAIAGRQETVMNLYQNGFDFMKRYQEIELGLTDFQMVEHCANASVPAEFFNLDPSLAQPGRVTFLNRRHKKEAWDKAACDALAQCIRQSADEGEWDRFAIEMENHAAIEKRVHGKCAQPPPAISPPAAMSTPAAAAVPAFPTSMTAAGSVSASDSVPLFSYNATENILPLAMPILPLAMPILPLAMRIPTATASCDADHEIAAWLHAELNGEETTASTFEGGELSSSLSSAASATVAPTALCSGVGYGPAHSSSVPTAATSCDTDHELAARLHAELNGEENTASTFEGGVLSSSAAGATVAPASATVAPASATVAPPVTPDRFLISLKELKRQPPDGLSEAELKDWRSRQRAIKQTPLHLFASKLPSLLDQHQSPCSQLGHSAAATAYCCRER